MDSGKDLEISDEEMLEMIESLLPVPVETQRRMREPGFSLIDPKTLKDVKGLHGDQKLPESIDISQKQDG